MRPMRTKITIMISSSGSSSSYNRMIRFSLTRFSLLVAVAAICFSIQTAAETTDADEFLGASAELQSVNSYLTGIGPLSMEPSSVVGHLKEARSIVDSVGDEVVSNGSDGEADPNVRCLFGNNPESLKTILDSLIRASKSCDQEATDFLALVKNQTFVGQFLHSYSERLASVCVGVQAGIVADKVEKSLDKVGYEIYELVADLAQAYAARERKTTATRGQIVISDSGKSVDPSEIIRTLKQVKLDTMTQRKLFATIIRNYYAETYPTPADERVTVDMRQERLRNFFIESLLDPCNELAERWSETVNYPLFASVPKRRIAETIEGRRRGNLSLDRSVEMVRICRKIRENSSSLLASVEK